MFNTDQPGFVPAPTPEQVPPPAHNADYHRALRTQYAQYDLLIKALTRLRATATDQQQLNLTIFDPADPIESSLMITSTDDINTLIDVLKRRYKTRQATISHQLSQYDSSPA